MEPRISTGRFFRHGWKPSYPSYNRRVNCLRCGIEIWDYRLKPHLRTEKCMNTGIPEDERPPLIRVTRAHTIKHVPCWKCGRPYQTSYLKRHLSTCKGYSEK